VALSSITFVAGSVALAGGNHQIFGIFDDDAGTTSGTAYTLLRGTTDDTSTAWAASAKKTLGLTSGYNPTRSGLHYLGILVDATTVPALQGSGANSGAAAAITPLLSGTSSTGRTSLPSPAAAPAAANNRIWAWVS
jgi:hypothetical protein